MPLTRIARHVFAVMVSVALVRAQGKLEERGNTRRFVSEKYGFSIAVPPKWLVDPSKDTPMFFSFGPSNAEDFNHQLKLPKGGAVISVVPLEIFHGLESRSLSDWAVADAGGDAVENPLLRAIEMPSATGIANAVMSSFDSKMFGPDDQSEHRVNIFWEFHQKLFAGHLMYPAHDPKGSEFEKIFLDTIHSIRPIEKAGKR